MSTPLKLPFLLLAAVIACGTDAGFTPGQERIEAIVENQSSREVIADFGSRYLARIKPGESGSATGAGVSSMTVCLYEVKGSGVVVDQGKKIRCKTFTESGTWVFR